MIAKTEFKSGFVALIGRPNVGKSTLLNAMVGQKIAIMAEKPQTTRNRIPGIFTSENAQIIFIDTPGVHKPKHKLGQQMVKVAEHSLAEVDVVLFVVDASAPPGKGDRFIADYFSKIRTPVYLVLNKIDLLSATKIEVVKEQYKKLYGFAGVFSVSALTGENLAAIRDKLILSLPEGPKYYPEEMVTDQPERFIVGELIREKVLHLTRDEVPHAVAVEVLEMTEQEEKNMMVIRANIYVERDTQKGIIIGQQGKMLKEVGSLARGDIEALLGIKVFLELWVKVRKGWRDSAGALHNLGYEV